MGTFAFNSYGIYLGTTQAMIAELRGPEVHLFRNAEGAESTPCAVYMTRANSLMVGRSAKERCESDPENAFMEFKHDMGSGAEYCFARNGRRMKPEELSAEVLKSLCGDVQRATGEIVNAAVITVPAYFDLPRTKATKTAAQLAGISHTVLMTEPVAAAQAYSFDSQEDKTFWLVYDFGGGTFDAAVVQVRDGLIQVAGHGGDNHLGGKDIDWAIVEEVFIPTMLKDRQLTDFRRGVPKWRGAIAKLKIQAEEAKLALSAPNRTSTEVCIDFLCNDDRGEPIEFEYLLKRSDLERVAGSFIRRTINVCKEILTSRGLVPADVGKMILAGEGTLDPFLRQMLSDPQAGLGIPLDFSVDPLTVVARGAAVYAASQRITPDSDPMGRTVPIGQFTVKLDYKPVDPEPDPEVTGTVTAGEGVEKDFSGYTIEFINPGIRSSWRSGKIGLGPKGSFLTNVSAEKGRENRFEIELRDAAGALQIATPSSFTIVAKAFIPILDEEFEEVMEPTSATPNAKDLIDQNRPWAIKENQKHLSNAMGREQRPITVFISYSHKDEALRNELKAHLRILQRIGLIATWHDRKIDPGENWKDQIDDNLERCRLILLLVSADFIASEYCYGLEMKRAIERHQAGDAIAVPIIIRDANWKSAPFAKLQALPRDGKAVTSWRNRDSAWRNVSEGIERLAARLRS